MVQTLNQQMEKQPMRECRKPAPTYTYLQLGIVAKRSGSKCKSFPGDRSRQEEEKQTQNSCLDVVQKLQGRLLFNTHCTHVDLLFTEIN